MDNQELANIVKETIKLPQIKEKPWIKFVHWSDQLYSIINLIPIVGGALANEIQTIGKTVTEYKINEFFRKFTYFICELGDMSDEARSEFVDEIENRAKDTPGNVIMGLIDRLDNINKEKILANLVKARGTKNISIEDFFRLSSVLERIPYVDLDHLHLYKEPYYDDNGDTELLRATGVLRPILLNEKGDKYILSPLGIKLLRWGLMIEIQVQEVIGTSMGLSWEEIKEVPDISITE